MSDKVFCGSGKVITTKFGDLTKISFSESDVKKLQENLSNGWINLVLKEKKEKVDGKPTHYLEVDTWKPDESKPSKPTTTKKPFEDDDLPF